MKIKRLSVANFGCLRDVSIDLGPLTVLVGPNNAGKSMILRAIEQLSRASVAQNGWGTIYGDLNKFDASTFDGRGLSQKFGIDGRIGEEECRYEVSVSQRHYTVPEIVGETVEFLDGDHKPRRVVRDPTNNQVGKIIADQEKHEVIFQGGATIPIVSPRTSLTFNQGPLPPAILEVFDRAGKLGTSAAALRRFCLSPGQLRTPVSVDAELPDPPHLQADGRGLAGAIANLLLSDRDAADRIENALRAGPSGVKRLKVGTRMVDPRSDLSEKPRPSRVYELALETSQGSTVSSSYISDGVLLYMAYLVLTMGPSSQSILMLEEPETGIHPGLLEKVLLLLRGLSEGRDSKPGVQVILTTHSPLLLNLVEPSEIRVVSRGADGGTQVTPFENASDLKRLLEFQGPGEIWANLGEDYILRRQQPAS